MPEDIREDISVVSVPCNTLADKARNPKGQNIVMIGAIIALLGDFTYDEGVNGMNDMFRKKGKSKFEEANVRAFSEGFRAIKGVPET